MSASGTSTYPPVLPKVAQRPTPYNLQKRFKGALVSVTKTGKKTTVPFQYNPAKLDRTLTPRMYDGPEGQAQFVGGASQSISVTVELQAVDTMVAQSKKNKLANAAKGLYAHLAALELLLYPATKDIETYRNDLDNNVKGAVPPQARPTLFVWGPQRVLPVNLKSMVVKEILFNIALSPVRAEVTLTMNVENVIDTEGDSYQLLLAHLKNMEQMRQTQGAEVFGSNKITGAQY